MPQQFLVCDSVKHRCYAGKEWEFEDCQCW